MHHASLRTALVAATMVLVTPTADAQSRALLVGFGGGQSFPTGDFGYDNKPGMSFGGFLQYRAPSKPIGVRGELTYLRNDMKEGLLASQGADPSATGYWSTLYLGVAGVYESMAEKGSFGWYLVAGGGMYQLKPTISQAGVEVSLPETKPGFNAGGGLRLRVGAASVYIEGRYHGLRVEETNLTFLPISLGVAF